MKMKYLKDEFGRTDKRYMISEDGSYIRDKKTGKKLIPYIGSKGYQLISITINGIHYTRIKIAHIQWMAWNGKIPNGYDIHHNGKDKYGNFDKLNDNINVLKCWTKKHHHGFHWCGENNPNYNKDLSGEKHPQAIMTQKKANKARYLRFYKNWNQQRIANKFKVSRSCINHIVNGYKWNPNNLSKQELINKSKILRTPI